MFIINIKKFNLITYLGVIFGIIAITFSFTKENFFGIHYFNYSLFFLILAGICDMFDGMIARKCNRTKMDKEFGIQIDSLADTINFVVLPVITMYSLGINSILAIIVYSLYIICGISRLAFFNCNASIENPVSVYTGLPVTFVAIIYPIFGLLYGLIPNTIYEILSIIITFTIAILFILNIKIPKSKKWAYILLPIIAIIVSFLLLVVKRYVL